VRVPGVSLTINNTLSSFIVPPSALLFRLPLGGFWHLKGVGLIHLESLDFEAVELPGGCCFVHSQGSLRDVEEK
jgi:hypothetical protein